MEGEGRKIKMDKTKRREIYEEAEGLLAEGLVAEAAKTAEERQENNKAGESTQPVHRGRRGRRRRGSLEWGYCNGCGG